jgi:uncharacterized protein
LIAGSMVTRFWSDLYQAYCDNPVIHIREFRLFGQWWDASDGQVLAPDEQPTYRTNFLPTIGYDGEVVLLSPELLQSGAGKYGQFGVGNVREDTLGRICARARRAPYMLEFLAGHDACKAECRYYGFCGGGVAANKFFELGTMSGTETLACKNSRKRLFDVLEAELQKTPGVSAREKLLPAEG